MCRCPHQVHHGELDTRPLGEAGIELDNIVAWMHDCVEANQKSYRDTLSIVCRYSDDNGCLPHSGSHVGEKFDCPVLDGVMSEYVCATAHSNRALVKFRETTGKAAGKKSNTRWFSEHRVIRTSIEPNVLNDKLLTWARSLKAVK